MTAGRCATCWIAVLVCCSGYADTGALSPSPSAAEYPSIQEALEANPGGMVFVPAREFLLDRAIRITTDGTGLWGHGRLVQANPNENILEIYGASGTRVAGVTLTRATDREETSSRGIHVSDCRDVELDGIRVVNNRSQAPAIHLERCRSSRVHGCTVLNYKRIGVDDRTASDLYGYAFRVIDGTGILATQCGGVLIQDNRVVERTIYPTEQTKEAHRLGEFTEGREPTKKGRLAPAGSYANNWHQGSAIVVTSPEETDHVLVSGNYIENAAQGIDLHADHVTCTNNIITHAFIGIKCMHGSKNVIITGNNVSHNDLWGLVMLPGTASHPAEAALEGRPARGANFTRGNIIANNVFSDFGFGYEYYNWKGAKGGVISLESGQLPENPVMTDVIVQGNIIYDTGRDQVLEDGVPTTVAPRYEYAVFITPDPRPEGLHFTGNIFHPGRSGISNISLADEK